MSKEPYEKLKHGKALCGKVFRTFVETFNWHTDFCRNLKGDGDIGEGKIKVDRSDPKHPVIRFPGNVGGEGEGAPVNDISCWRLVKQVDANGNQSLYLADCYYSFGGVLHHHGDISLSGLIAGQPSSDEGDVDTILCVTFSVSGNYGNGQPGGDGDFVIGVRSVLESDLQSMQSDMETYVYPLFKMRGDIPITDLRTSLKPQVVEL